MVNIHIDVDKAIKSLIGKLQDNPRIIYSESDLQTLLSIELSTMDELLPIEKGKTCRVHREYPYYKNGRAHDFDIAIFAQEDIVNINSKLGELFINEINSNGKKEKRNVVCSHLIELKMTGKDVINYFSQNPKKHTIKRDFDFLRKGYTNHESLRQKDGINNE